MHTRAKKEKLIVNPWSFEENEKPQVKRGPNPAPMACVAEIGMYDSFKLNSGDLATLLVLAVIWRQSARSVHEEQAVSLRGPLKYDEN